MKEAGWGSREYLMADIKPPPTSFSREVEIWAGAPPRKKSKFLGPDQKLRHARPTSKSHCPYNLEGHLSTNPISSALHLQGPKSDIYVHFH
jgi:hypothetical protein